MVKVVPSDERMNVSSVDHPNKSVKITFIPAGVREERKKSGENAKAISGCRTLIKIVSFLCKQDSE